MDRCISIRSQQGNPNQQETRVLSFHLCTSVVSSWRPACGRDQGANYYPSKSPLVPATFIPLDEWSVIFEAASKTSLHSSEGRRGGGHWGAPSNQDICQCARKNFTFKRGEITRHGDAPPLANLDGEPPRETKPEERKSRELLHPLCLCSKKIVKYDLTWV